MRVREEGRGTSNQGHRDPGKRKDQKKRGERRGRRPQQQRLKYKGGVGVGVGVGEIQ